MSKQREAHIWPAVYSPDDGGWYVEVTDKQGRDLHRTPVMAERMQAVTLAQKWFMEYQEARS